jgi:hypothetical protein
MSRPKRFGANRAWPATSPPYQLWHDMHDCIRSKFEVVEANEAYLTVPSKRKGLWGMTERRDRRSCSRSFEMSTPSTRIRPALSSVWRKRATRMLDLPAPVRPAMPTCSRFEDAHNEATQEADGRRQEMRFRDRKMAKPAGIRL